MNLKFIIHDFKSHVTTWLRSVGTVFWTILFPVLLILIFGAIFSGGDDISYELVLQDLDDTDYSNGFVNFIESVDIIELKTINKDTDIKTYIKDEGLSAGLIIPEGFEESIIEYRQSSVDPTVNISDLQLPFNLSLITDPSDQTTSQIIRNTIVYVLYEFNMNVTDSFKIISLNEESSVGDDFEFIDFFVPGMIGFTIMTSMIYGSIERNTKYRKDGILRKLQTMPISQADWIIAKMLFMLVLSFISTFVIMFFGILVWGLSIKINIFFFILVVSTSFLFSGMGMIISRFVKEEETADMAGGAITFPMMFLAGTFFPLEQMPSFLQSVAQVLPLYYVNEGFRNAMIFADIDKTLYFTGIVLAFALILFVIGVFLTKWKED